MTSMRKLMETTDQLFDDRVAADIAAHQLDQERREREADENLPYDIDSIVQHIRSNPQQFSERYIEDITDDPSEIDTDILSKMADHYFDTVVAQTGLPDDFVDSKTMIRLVTQQLQNRGYTIDPQDVAPYLS